MGKIDHNYDALHGYNDDYSVRPDFEQINSPHVVSTITKYGRNKNGKLVCLCIKIKYNDFLYKKFSIKYHPTKFFIAQNQIDDIKVKDKGTRIVFSIDTLSESYLKIPLNYDDYYNYWKVLISNKLKAKDNKSFSEVIS